ncbi:TetR/AcrR family transcriptional regulator [Streptomyces sp. NPDC001508]|uniref:TetR/AcrR family transcriptional regulator n=1 Tax=Streptomyces sp. NPDC001508 TaxID=3154656 RepID=UPI00332EFF49
MTPQKPAPTGARAEPPAGAARPARADARRNRDKLIDAARAAFAASDDTVALEAIARAAGVGIGTLYRNFPTREALVEAVYAAELDDVTTSAPALLDAFPPEVALRAWLDRYAAFVVTKRGMLDTLRAGWASGRIATSTTRERITGALDTLLKAGARTGALRADVAPEDATLMLLGVFLATANDATPDQTARLLDLLTDALSARKGRGTV